MAGPGPEAQVRFGAGEIKVGMVGGKRGSNCTPERRSEPHCNEDAVERLSGMAWAIHLRLEVLERSVSNGAAEVSMVHWSFLGFTTRQLVRVEGGLPHTPTTSKRARLLAAVGQGCQAELHIVVAEHQHGVWREPSIAALCDRERFVIAVANGAVVILMFLSG